MEVSVRVASLPSNSLSYSNRIFLNRQEFDRLSSGASAASTLSHEERVLVNVLGWVFTASPHEMVAPGTVGLNALQRRTLNVSLETPLFASTYRLSPSDALASLTVSVEPLTKGKARAMQVDADKLTDTFKFNYSQQILAPGQSLAMDVEGNKVKLTVTKIARADPRGAGGGGGQNGDRGAGGGGGEAAVRAGGRGLLVSLTEICWVKVPGSNLNLSGQTGGEGGGQNIIFRADFDFAKLGIGGLGGPFNQIFRRAFASRIFNPTVVKEMGINHVRGMLLYGPPGCGKTLIARQIGKVLNAREPKIVNGPEVLDKYVGGSEEKIRGLFIDAEKEQAEQGDASMLHIIIFDEIDAICKTRGSSRDGTGVSDSVVNQLLSKIDGVDSLNNVLIIGMTNRKDMIDDALLRPGRLEVHVEITLPDEAGRLQIINIHTRGMRENGRLDKEAMDNTEELARLTKNFSGAEIEGLVKSAASFAFHRGIDAKDLSKKGDTTNLVVTWQDFMNALGEVQPKFGADNSALESLFANGMVNYGPNFQRISTTLKRLVEQTRTSARTPLMTVLLQGEADTGKTAIMAHTAVSSGYPFIRKISADELIGMGDVSRANFISKIFLDSYKSPLSFILIDNLERIIEYTRIGPRFSNVVLQTLLVLLKKAPPVGHRLIVMATTAVPEQLAALALAQHFDVVLDVPELSEAEDIKTVLGELVPMSQEDMDSIAMCITSPIGIKRLLNLTEMARTDDETVTCERFLECLHTGGSSVEPP